MSPSAPPVIDGFSDLVPIGRGGFSTVYSATQAGIGRRVAIKVLDLGFSDERRFRRECTTLGQLSGIRGVVPVLQATFTASGQPCIVMQLMGGGSLAHRIRATGPLSPIDTVRNGTELSNALQQAHELRIFHRDIKPENVLFSGNDAAIADFGIALVDDIESRSQTMDSISPPHAPPERFEAGHADPVLGDIYSLGSTLYTALAGRPPFGTAAQGGLAGLVHRVTTEPLPAIARDDLPEPLREVLERALAKEPVARFQSMASFAGALEAVTAAPDGTVRRPIVVPPPIDPTVLRAPAGSAAAPAPDPVPASTNALGSPPPPPPPTEAIPAVPPQAAAWGAPPSGMAQPGVAGTPPAATLDRRRRGAAAIWGAAAAMLVLSLAGLGVVVAWPMIDPGGSDPAPTTTTTSSTASTTTATPTTAPPPTAPPPTAPPTTATPVTTTVVAPTTTAAPLPVDTATRAVDSYLAAASGGDLDAFAAQWSYPIAVHYSEQNTDEAELRDDAVRYWARFNDLIFTRVSPTTVSANDLGWDTTTDYRAELTFTDGTFRCEVNRIRLGYDRSWRVRTATEESNVGTC